MNRTVGSEIKTLVICVDRDNDIGEKAGLKTPIIGKEASLSAATKLALADPEDSDVNAIFEAIRLCEQLKSTEENARVEIVLVAGDKNAGVDADRKIGEELEKVLSKTAVESAILVSDGAEDEWIIPILGSRVKIDSVRRVVVKQSEQLESTFYLIKRLFEDPKFSRTFLPPVGIILFLLALSLVFNLSDKAVGIILAFLGIYILLKGLGHENVMVDFIEDMKQALYSGKISFVTYICALVLLIAGSFQGIMEMPETSESILVDMVYYIKGAIWWYVGAALAPLIGKMMNMLIEGEKIVRQWAILFSVIASGLILWGGSECVILLAGNHHLLGYLYLFLSLLGAIILSFMGVTISRYVKGTVIGKEEVEIEAEAAMK